MELLWYFLAGSFAANAIPHLVKGITGEKHMTVFARVSSPIVNVLWGFTNVVGALFLFGVASGKGGLTPPWEAGLMGINLLAVLAGALVLALVCANLFGNPNNKLPWHK